MRIPRKAVTALVLFGLLVTSGRTAAAQATSFKVIVNARVSTTSLTSKEVSQRTGLLSTGGEPRWLPGPRWLPEPRSLPGPVSLPTDQPRRRRHLRKH